MQYKQFPEEITRTVFVYFCFKYASIFLICTLTLAIHKHPLKKPEKGFIYELILSLSEKKNMEFEIKREIGNTDTKLI